jgi:hypothetical protein
MSQKMKHLQSEVCRLPNSNPDFSLTCFFSVKMCCEDDDDSCCPCLSKQTQDRLFVVVVVGLIGFGYFSYWFLLVFPWRWYSSLTGWANLIFLNTAFALLCYSYYKAMYTVPGYVLKDWVSFAERKKPIYPRFRPLRPPGNWRGPEMIE